MHSVNYMDLTCYRWNTVDHPQTPMVLIRKLSINYPQTPCGCIRKPIPYTHAARGFQPRSTCCVGGRVCVCADVRVREESMLGFGRSVTFYGFSELNSCCGYGKYCVNAGKLEIRLYLAGSYCKDCVVLIFVGSSFHCGSFRFSSVGIGYWLVDRRWVRGVADVCVRCICDA